MEKWIEDQYGALINLSNCQAVKIEDAIKILVVIDGQRFIMARYDDEKTARAEMENIKYFISETHHEQLNSDEQQAVYKLK